MTISNVLTFSTSGLCAFRGVDERDAEMRFCLYDFNFGDEPSELYKTFHDDTDMEDSSDPLPKETLTDLLSLGRVLRTNVIPYNDAVAAMVLLCIGGLVVLFPVFFNNPSKRKVCGALMALSALILGYGIMTAGSLVFTTWRVQNLANAFLSGASPIVISFGNVKLQSGSRLWICLVVALVMNAAFIFLITLSAFIRNIFPLSENKPKKPKKVKAQKFQAKGIRGIKIKGRKGGRW